MEVILTFLIVPGKLPNYLVSGLAIAKRLYCVYNLSSVNHYLFNVLIIIMFIFALTQKRTKKVKTDYKILRKYYGIIRHG